jgi:N-sulfoglucosamine sulfohydrolase
MNRRFTTFSVLMAAVSFAMAGSLSGSASVQAADAARPNVLMITFDDMNWDSLGCTGCPIPGISPNIDRLAKEGKRFLHAHVTIAVCQPTRAVWMTGRYPHRNGALGFQPIALTTPTLQEQLRKAGYFNGIMAKVSHLAPQHKFCWDVAIQPTQLGVGRSPELYYQHAKAFFAKAKAEDRPFFLMANSQDPHRPFAGSRQENQRKGANPTKKKNTKKQLKPRGNQYSKASKYFKPDEIVVPKFLPDIPDIRKELAQYFTSVHRADEIAGAVLKALDEAGLSKNTLVMFMSDHGMPLPFAKTNCWLNSTRTPWIVRWPGVVEAGAVDKEHMISGIDFTPTILDALGLPQLDGVDGRSFLPLLKGEKQTGREEIYTVFHRTAGRRNYEMRCVLTKQFGYIFNAWSDGQSVFRNESQSGLAFRAMQTAAKKNADIAARVKLFEYRVPEEFYNYTSDPAALHNLIDDKNQRERIAGFRQSMRARMKKIDDPVRAEFEKRFPASE